MPRDLKTAYALGVLFAITTIAVWSGHAAAVVGHRLGKAGARAVQAAVLGCAGAAAWVGFSQVLELSDAAIAVMAVPNVVALLLSTPKIVAELRARRS